MSAACVGTAQHQTTPSDKCMHTSTPATKLHAYCYQCASTDCTTPSLHKRCLGLLDVLGCPLCPAATPTSASCSSSPSTHVGRRRSTRAMPTVVAASCFHKSFTCNTHMPSEGSDNKYEGTSTVDHRPLTTPCAVPCIHVPEGGGGYIHAGWFWPCTRRYVCLHVFSRML